MKKVVIILAIITLPISLMAQEKVKQKEIGLIVQEIDRFGLTFKTGTNKSLWRFNTLAISGSNTENKIEDMYTKKKSDGINITTGKEFHKKLSEKIEFVYGLELEFEYSKFESEREDPIVSMYSKRIETRYRPGINVVLGFKYVFKNNILIGAEILPGLNYVSNNTETINYDQNINERVTEKDDFKGYTYGFSNTTAQITLAYRF